MADVPAPSDRSWWLEEALSSEPDSTRTPALRGHRNVDVAIVGGGFAGLWTALKLKKRAPALSIAIIERDICGGGASGKNGGKVAGYWTALGRVSEAYGAEAALELARLGTLAQDEIRAFCAERDVWWHERGAVVVATSAREEESLEAALETATSLGVPQSVRRLSAQEAQALCRIPRARMTIHYAEGATVQPARLARALRCAALASGVAIFEHTAMTALSSGSPNAIETPSGTITATHVVLATNTELSRHPLARDYLSVFSSYVVATAPCPEALAAIWPSDAGYADAAMFLHYFRKTDDGRVIMGSGSGPVAAWGDPNAASNTHDLASVARAAAGIAHLLPDLKVPIAASWGGGIDVASDRLPFVRTVPGRQVHLAAGLSGHGVNPTALVAETLASRILGDEDAWSRSIIASRTLPKLPPEPFRTLGGRAVRWGILSCEAAERQERQPPAQARLLAALPKLMGLRVGVR
ncbi:NAD(P)/FAD-dependent oxidoreductase [Xanthobacter pseudotagetidis]|uniref:NAD(P)/FAD-dependent oxidoreductase n=1 Tax=Xanthobacter pseudotagetidis TaxID=3119911 RepID=UPI00372808B4